ncbi:MAG: DUF2059 domain-containing protein [Gammaproteobacteria bacterium]|nr:DUF2059 domain-containing protein [Gammaproteobacteria bacterium]
MKKISALFSRAIAVLSVIAITITTNANAATASDAEIYDLLDKSGATRTLETLPMQMQMMGQQMALTAKDPQAHQDYMSILLSSMDTDVMQQRMLQSVRKNATSEEIQAMLVWLNSDLGQRIVAAETEATNPDFQQNMMQFMAGLQSNPPAPERTQAIIGYIEASKITDQTMKLIESLVATMFDAAKALKPEDTQLAETLDIQLPQMMDMMKPALEQQMILASYYVYRDMSNEELAQYGGFYQKEIGKKHMSLIVESVSYAMNDWGESMMKQIIAEEDKS